MTELHQVLAERVSGWRSSGYEHGRFPAIAEILLHARNEDGSSRYLREPQIRALETYWYLRLAEGTPHMADLYERLFPQVSDRLTALGLDQPAIKDVVLNDGYAGLLARIGTDDTFVRQHRLEGLRETLNLDYPSWILALAMGAGKTILIGAVVATEFAMALEYPDADPPFIENALVFAPGKTIIESLRELSSTRYELLLPPRLYTPFATSLKLTFTRDGERDVAVTRASRFNLVVTNTEKIRIQARPVRRNASFLQLAADEPRDAVLVALGSELACEAWLEDHNRHRPINKLEIIELRSDPKYGHFFEHRAASARVHLEPMEGDRARVVIDDFISPSILERLSTTEGVLAPQVTDWRSMVDSVMIDTAYDSEVFNVVVADVPERKADVVAGTYEVEVPAGSSAPVAMKITDMLGEEVLVVLPIS